MTASEVITRLLIISVLSGIIGFERERRGRAAGFRTHLLVGVGSCLIITTGLFVKAMPGNELMDPSRMAAQVVSGLGFLGAGTIIRFRATVKGLTTAASLWAVGGIGLAIGAGFYSGGFAAAVIVIGTLFLLAGIERWIRPSWVGSLHIESAGSDSILLEVRETLHEFTAELLDFEATLSDSGSRKWVLHVLLPNKKHKQAVISQLVGVAGIRVIHWE